MAFADFIKQFNGDKVVDWLNIDVEKAEMGVMRVIHGMFRGASSVKQTAVYVAMAGCSKTKLYAIIEPGRNPLTSLPLL